MSLLNTQQIMEIIPHRYPMLMLDTVEELVPGERAVAYKNISINEEILRYISIKVEELDNEPSVILSRREKEEKKAKARAEYSRENEEFTEAEEA